MSAAPAGKPLPVRSLEQMANAFVASFGTDNVRRMAVVFKAVGDAKDGLDKS